MICAVCVGAVTFISILPAAAICSGYDEMPHRKYIRQSAWVCSAEPHSDVFVLTGVTTKSR